MDVSAVAPFSNVTCPSCGKHTRVKREFGPYTLMRRHAIGGMSVVFIAQDNTLDREVVVKILNEEYGGDDRRIAAFEEEARITASFSHPHVVRVFTTGRAFQRFYIAMELVPGGHFEHHIRERGSIPEGEMLPLAIQVAAGLKAAHAAGLIHRDMKPGNILLDAAGNAKIVDFGLALVTKGGKAQAAEIWATPYYVPPETIEGLPEDFRSDIYAFGATLYHALAGKPSCNEESMDTNRLREAKKKVLPLAKAAPWVSADTCALVDRAMAHDPSQRFRSYDDLLAALETARQRLASGKAAPAPAKAAVVKRASAGEKFALAGASMLVLAALGFGLWWVFKADDRPPPQAGNGKPVAPVVLDPSGGDNGARIGSAYREAGEALRAGDAAKARGLFAEVRDQPGVLEPTGTWAACETVVCAFLEGDGNGARKDARAAAEHVQAATGLDADSRATLLETVEKLPGLRPVVRADETAASSGAGLLAALMAGLKNWEQGLPALAMPHFQAVLAAEAAGPDAWVAPYQEFLRRYLDDERRLRSAIPDALPATAEACRGLADELHAVHATLKTKGRARFNIRALQLELEKRARALEASGDGGKPDPVPASDPLAAARQAAAACRFADAAAQLKQSGKAGEPGAAGFLVLTEAASAFLGDLEDRLVQPPQGVALQLRDGSSPGRVTGSRPGGVKVLDASGSPRDIEWHEISADSLIDLHRLLMKGEANELDRLRRHEQAIAFDLLAGDPERGRKAGDSLATASPAFKRRWDQMLAALD
jgi:tRNA A-37 threonylcarbamoyl transferase component Bud32